MRITNFEYLLSTKPFPVMNESTFFPRLTKVEEGIFAMLEFVVRNLISIDLACLQLCLKICVICKLAVFWKTIEENAYNSTCLTNQQKL